jgi:hypothetical protein
VEDREGLFVASITKTKHQPARRRSADPLDALLRQAIRLAPDAKTRAWLEVIQGGQRAAGDGVIVAERDDP